MLRVGLTGGIATGKSYVVDRCRQQGIPCLDADELAHGVMAPGTEATAQIVARFGDVLDASGAVDRRALAAIVFADEGARRDLERIVHPAVFRAIGAGLRGFEMIGGSALTIVAIPLLYETGREGDFDRIIATTCSEASQRLRLIARGLTAQEADRRLAAQLPAADKAARADYVIDTDGTLEATDAQLASVIRQLHKSINL